jgi:hypothetical protein
MDKTETLAILGTQSIRRRQTKQTKIETNTTKQNKKQNKTRKKPTPNYQHTTQH